MISKKDLPIRQLNRVLIKLEEEIKTETGKEIDLYMSEWVRSKSPRGWLCYVSNISGFDDMPFSEASKLVDNHRESLKGTKGIYVFGGLTYRNKKAKLSTLACKGIAAKRIEVEIK